MEQLNSALQKVQQQLKDLEGQLLQARGLQDELKKKQGDGAAEE